MPSNHLILCHPLLLPPSIFPSIRVFSNESVLRIRCPKYWSFSFSISPSNEYSGLISFRMDWLDLLAVQGTLSSPSPPAFSLSQHQGPSINISESALHIKWPKYWSCSFSISPSSEYSGLISFRIYWLDLLAVQGTPKSFLLCQFKSINSLALSLLYGPTLTSIHDYGKNHMGAGAVIWQGKGVMR